MNTLPGDIVSVPITTPEIDAAERRGEKFQQAILVLVVVVLIGTVVGVIYSVRGQAKQETTKRAAESAAVAASRQLTISERQDCRSEYNSVRSTVVEDANTAAREVQGTIIGYLLGTNGTDSITEARVKLAEVNARVTDLESLPDMVDHGWTDLDGVKYPPCPVVK